MSDVRLTLTETAILYALMAEATEIPNPELKARFRLDLSGEARRKLNDHKLVESRKVGRAYVHELTDRGWAWCHQNLTAEVPPRPGPAGGALFAVLGNLRRYLERAELSLADVFTRDEVAPPPVGAPDPIPDSAPAPDLQTRIRVAYRELAPRPNSWVGLADLRRLLGDAPREEVDRALRALLRHPDVSIVPESNQKTLTVADRQAALRVGGQDNHLLAIA